MRLLLLRHGIGRSFYLVSKFNRNFFADLFNIFDVTPVYVYRPISVVPATRSSPKSIAVPFHRNLLFPSEKVIQVPSITSSPDFSSIFKQDHYRDNFSSFNNLYYQHETLRLGIKGLSLDQYDLVVCYRDDMILSSRTCLLSELTRATDYFVTSMFEWHEGVFERFYACPPSVFRSMIVKDHFIYEAYSNSKRRLDSYKYTGERLAHKVIQKSRISIWPIPLYTYRVRIGPYMACESNKIRIQDIPLLLPHLMRKKLSSFF